ncbi:MULTISPECIES: histidine phosphatase family protein [unclassified Streptomyces]|uniref:SixA phosphatase family protein n=1 Tax=unclassified Streptomyces TaxID=2593676 RepID=UPI002E13A2BE|nr:MULTISPECIES: histidine phosphatase family protein [unclassified Streptomyces]WSR27126.1 histidine phosphatase family protein [Streptomyces sp. NBC_01205]
MMSGNLRRLVVLRHAKSAWPPDVADSERPLAPRGRRDAPAAGRWLREAGCVPDLVVCSPALRTRQTWGLVAAEFAAATAVIQEARIYRAGAGELLEVVREIPAQVRTLMLIGHNPGVQELVLLLTGEADGYALEQTRTKFPTSAIAVLSVSGPWTSLEPGAARLTDMVVPRGANP